MADLGTLNPNAAVANTTNDWGVGAVTDVDEPIASADGNEVGDDSNVSTDRNGRYALANVPGDLGTVDTIAANVRYRVLGGQTNTRSLFVRIVTDEATPTNLTSEATVATGITNTTASNSGALTLTVQGTPTKAQWDNAVVQLRLNITKNMGGDSNGIRVDAVDVTGTYTPAAAAPNEGSASGAIGWVGSAAGSAAHEGASSGSVAWAGSADGATTHEGSSSGAVAWAGSADGAATHEGSSTGAVAWVGSATGEAPTVGGASGSASGTVSWVGSADGAATHEGASTGAVSWVGSAEGVATYSGSADGSIARAGSATGESPIAGVNAGTSTGSIAWSGSATGAHVASGLSAGGLTWSGSASGDNGSGRRGPFIEVPGLIRAAQVRGMVSVQVPGSSGESGTQHVAGRI